jgi:cytochrome P450
MLTTAHRHCWIVDTMTDDIAEMALPTIVYDGYSAPEEFHDALAKAQRVGPIALGPLGPELLSYDLVRTVLRDPRFIMPTGVSLAMQGITSGPVWDRVAKLLMGLDGRQHQRLRRLVAKAFNRRGAEQMRSACIEVITELVEAHAAVGRCDIVADIARPYPVQIICALLGAPRHDWALFSGWADDISKVLGTDVAEDTPAIVRAWGELEGYVEELIAARRHCLTDDLISQLLRAEDDGDRLNYDELVNLVVMLLNAGTHTTRNQLAAAIQVLCDHPDQWELLAAQPELAPQAVEELMRHSPAVFAVARKTVVDVEFGGVAFPAGSFVMANTAAANRDPAVYENPERLDIARGCRPPMLAFGGGVGYCLGAYLARVELTEAVRVITRRIQNPRLTRPAPWKPPVGITGPITLAIEFTGRVALSGAIDAIPGSAGEGT